MWKQEETLQNFYNPLERLARNVQFHRYYRINCSRWRFQTQRAHVAHGGSTTSQTITSSFSRLQMKNRNGNFWTSAPDDGPRISHLSLFPLRMRITRLHQKTWEMLQIKSEFLGLLALGHIGGVFVAQGEGRGVGGGGDPSSENTNCWRRFSWGLPLWTVFLPHTED